VCAIANALKQVDEGAAGAVMALKSNIPGGLNTAARDMPAHNAYLGQLGEFVSKYSFSYCLWLSEPELPADPVLASKERLSRLLQRKNNRRFARCGQYVVGLCDRSGETVQFVAVGAEYGIGMMVSNGLLDKKYYSCEKSILDPQDHLHQIS